MELIEHELARNLLGGTRKVWVQRPSSAAAADCLIFLDAEIYLDRVKAPVIIDALQDSGDLPPFSNVFLSFGDTACRHRDFTCNESFAAFLATQFLPWITGTIGPHTRYWLCGLSLSGLEALFTMVRHPGLFAGALSQSPSAWWNDEWLASSLQDSTTIPGCLWVSVGAQELEVGVSHPPTGLLQKNEPARKRPPADRRAAPDLLISSSRRISRRPRSRLLGGRTASRPSLAAHLPRFSLNRAISLCASRVSTRFFRSCRWSECVLPLPTAISTFTRLSFQ